MTIQARERDAPHMKYHSYVVKRGESGLAAAFFGLSGRTEVAVIMVTAFVFISLVSVTIAISGVSVMYYASRKKNGQHSCYNKHFFHWCSPVWFTLIL